MEGGRAANITLNRMLLVRSPSYLRDPDIVLILRQEGQNVDPTHGAKKETESKLSILALICKYRHIRAIPIDR